MYFKHYNMIYITILDFSVGKVHQYEVQNCRCGTTEEFEKFIESKGFRLNDIEWMSHYNKTIYEN